MSLYEGAVKKPIMTSLCFLAVVIFGLFSLSRLPIDLYPDIDTNTIMVMTAYPGASASDIENNVTRPLENVLNAVSNLKHITSRSSENMSMITLEFEFGKEDIDVLTNDVRDKLDMVSSVLPDAAETPIIFKFSADMIPIVLLSVQANESRSALYKILDDRVVNTLARIPGVGTVSISGAPKREVQVYCDPYKLEAYNLSIETISAIIGAENRNVPGGNFDIGNETYSLRVEGEFSDTRQLGDVVVGAYNGATVYLKDVAKVVDTVQERAQETYTNGVKGAIIVVQKQSGANSVDIARKVQEVLPRLQKNMPSDVKLGVIVNTSENILNTIDSLTETVMYALLFVVLVVFFFLGRWRATLIICITIPLSLIASFIYLAISGNTINIISLSSLSIAIGMVVDDAIVVLENVTTHIERGSDPKQAAVHGTNEVAISVVASTLTMIAVFFPLTMISGMSGVLFKQLGWMMCAIMFISTVSALSLTPMLCSQLLRLQRKQSKAFLVFFAPIERTLDGLDNAYARLLNWAVRHRALVLAGCVAFFVLSLLCAKAVGTEFFPAQDNARIAVKLELPIGARKEVAQEIAQRLAEQWMTKYKGVMKVCNYTVGQADSDNTWASMQTNGSHIISFNISLVDPADRDISLATVCDEMRQDLKDYPEFNKAQVIFGGNNTGMAAQSSADFEVYGYSMAETDSVAAKLKRALLKVEGVSEVNISRSDYQPEYQVDFDREKLPLHGLNLTTAAGYLRNRINGSIASRYREDGEEYDIKVRYAPEFRTSLDAIENILVYNARGEGVRIKELGTVVERFAPPTIERKDRQRIVTVSAVVSGVPLSKVVAAGNAIIDKMDIPSEVTVQVSGSFEDQQESFADLGTLGVLIILLVFIVMAAQFESLTYPFILILSVPFAIGGVLMALFLTNTTLSVMSLLGSIMLIGIVVKNGIVLIDYTILCRERGRSVLSAVVTAGKSRLRPVLMTTMTTVLGMIPMAIGTGQGSEMWSPMAIAVIGGLTVSTILTLIYVPTMYCIFGGIGIKRQRRKMRKQLELDAYFAAQKNN
ncbi:multidrug transporter AcrB [Bacteroides heparinolyticus]|uniref:HAE1 family hydrophobic/amphiphilic exporter-1 n=2 Tax=Prevotella heparinolytica TaxID=28113 RepID=A0A2R3MRK5_9BACE|nr:efflux RND transporter permease subunit [Bacteroides heparinolyticus]AVM57524.1 multidrug transporter AcrB [Bacteroides heparinolyticus]TCO92146.1 HAE1 family hydrophobic/amphiphilic exporter-1 [Bacteroides heparinolyticus]